MNFYGDDAERLTYTNELSAYIRLIHKPTGLAVEARVRDKETIPDTTVRALEDLRMKVLTV